MAVFTVDVRRFDSTASVAESAEKQRVTASRQIIPNARPPQADNGDFAAHADKRGSFTKDAR